MPKMGLPRVEERQVHEHELASWIETDEAGQLDAGLVQSFEERRLHPGILWRPIGNSTDGRHVLGDAHSNVLAIVRNLVYLYGPRGKPREPAKWWAKLRTEPESGGSARPPRGGTLSASTWRANRGTAGSREIPCRLAV